MKKGVRAHFIRTPAPFIFVVLNTIPKSIFPNYNSFSRLNTVANGIVIFIFIFKTGIVYARSYIRLIKAVVSVVFSIPTVVFVPAVIAIPNILVIPVFGI